jgi:pseudaminic acid synthase
MKINLLNRNKPILIAEISCNHCGKKDKLLNHIVKAKKAGADLVKIQTYEPQDLTIKSNQKKFKIEGGIWNGRNLWDIYTKAQTPFKWHSDVFKLAKKIKIPVFSTPFSLRAVKFLDKFNLPLYKISSFEITDYQLISEIAKRKKPIIISTGMSSIKEIKRAIAIIKKYHQKIIILYCVSGYPTRIEDSNIKTINILKKTFKNYEIGLSDHTNDINSSLAAIANGAKFIEKHFITSKKINSLDAKFSIDVKQFGELRERGDQIFFSLGKEKMRLKNSEKKSIKFRRSIFAKKDIKKGEYLSEKNMKNLRPVVGITSNNYYKIIGKKSKRSIKKDSPIKHNYF